MPLHRHLPLIQPMLLRPVRFEECEYLHGLRRGQFVFEGGHIAVAHVASAVATVQRYLHQQFIAVMPGVAAVVVGWGGVFAVGQWLLPVGLALQVRQVATGAMLGVKRLADGDVVGV